MRRLAIPTAEAAVAAPLSLSIRTVEQHLRNIYGRLALPNRASAVRDALNHHLI